VGCLKPPCGSTAIPGRGRGRAGARQRSRDGGYSHWLGGVKGGDAGAVAGLVAGTPVSGNSSDVAEVARSICLARYRRLRGWCRWLGRRKRRCRCHRSIRCRRECHGRGNPPPPLATARALARLRLVRIERCRRARARRWFARYVDDDSSTRISVFDFQGELVATAIGTVELGVPNCYTQRGGR